MSHSKGQFVIFTGKRSDFHLAQVSSRRVETIRQTRAGRSSPRLVLSVNCNECSLLSYARMMLGDKTLISCAGFGTAF